MKINEYRGILFIEDDIETNCSYEKEFNTRTTGINNHLKSLNDLRDEIIETITVKYHPDKKFNVIKNFHYGQRELLRSFDDIVFYGSGILTYVDDDTYQQLLLMADENYDKKPHLLINHHNEIMYVNAPVQIDKIALYTYKNKYLGQVKLKNMVVDEIRKVILKITPVNSFGEKSSSIIYHEIIRKKQDSNNEFGDEHTIIFNEKDMETFICEIIEVFSTQAHYDYSNFETTAINRSKRFKDIYDDKQIEFLAKKFTQMDITRNTYIPCIDPQNIYIIDCHNTIHYVKDAKDCVQLIDYINSSSFIDECNDYWNKLEQEQFDTKMKSRKKEKKVILLICFIVVVSLILLVRYAFGQPVNKITDANTLKTVQEIKQNIKSGNYEKTIDQIMNSQEIPITMEENTEKHIKEYYDLNHNLLLTLTINDKDEDTLSIECEAKVDKYQITLSTLYQDKQDRICPYSERGYIQITIIKLNGEYINYHEIIDFFTNRPQHYILKLSQILEIDFIDRCQYLLNSRFSIEETAAPFSWRYIEENTDVFVNHANVKHDYYHYY